jgi:L-2-hydroxyglutarate oxidase LhgO
MPEFARADAEVKAGVASRRLFVPPPTACAPPADFTMAGPADHGIDAPANRFGIESPGLTSSPAIARHVAALLAT